MSNRRFLADPNQPCSSKQQKTSHDTNWETWALCQTVTDEPMQCPTKLSKPPIGKGYVFLAENLLEFQALGRLPLDLGLERLDNG